MNASNDGHNRLILYFIPYGDGRRRKEAPGRRKYKSLLFSNHFLCRIFLKKKKIKRKMNNLKKNLKKKNIMNKIDKENYFSFV